jgi:magnesium transporter
MPETAIEPSELYEVWPVLSEDERVEGFELLKRDAADAFFLQLSARDRAQLVLALPAGERRLWMRLLAPDDAADVIQETPVEKRESLLDVLDEVTRREVKGLLDYAEDEAGGLMNTRYSRLRRT